MAKKDSQKLKFSEWRPIGVCDKAEPGVQKAQMFSREDFLVITADGIDRENWRKNPTVKRVLAKYTAKLARQSTRTQKMIKPEVSKIGLVGAIMHLRVTPVLNKESEDGKLQLFQVEFYDAGKKKNIPWLSLIIGILSLILITLISLIIIKVNSKEEFSKPRRFNLPNTSWEFCNSTDNISRYHENLDETRRSMQWKVYDLINQGQIDSDPMCNEQLNSTILREQRFLECYELLWGKNLLTRMDRTDLNKINSCRVGVCEKPKFDGYPSCLRR